MFLVLFGDEAFECGKFAFFKVVKAVLNAVDRFKKFFVFEAES